jgi:flavorubredoxin
MRNITLFNNDNHSFILLNESEPGEEDGIRSNQYLITHNDEGVLLDPGGFGVMPRVLSEMLRYVNPKQIKGIFLSHQDPDIVGGLSTWMELIHSPIFVSSIWIRFLPHYGLKDMARFVGVPNEGMVWNDGGEFSLKIVPAHFLHSEGQINVYDPISKILFTGDIGAAMLPVDKDYVFVDDFDAHLSYITSFHRRYMCSNKAILCWLETIKDLDIQILAPQHGPIYRGKAVQQFFDWFGKLECGVDVMQPFGHFPKG